MILTKSELEIMDTFWNEQVPLSRSDLLAYGGEKSWKDGSIHILLNGLLQKGAIRESGYVRRNKTYGRLFETTMSREEYFANTIFSYRYKPEMKGLFAALLDRPEVDIDLLDDLQSRINELRRK